MILTAAKRFMELSDIRIEDIPLREMVHMQRAASKITWRPSPGRHISCAATHKGDIIALIHLASPVMNMKRRDIFLGLPSDMRQKGLALRQYLDLSVCVGIQPLAWYWNLGKLAAMAAPSLHDKYKEAYGNNLKGIITTSVWGRSSQYNRVYRHIGFSSGFGHEHVSDEELRKMKEALKQAGTPKSNWKHSRMAVISDYRRYILGQPHEQARAMKHGHKRGIYFHAVVEYTWPEAVRRWYERWGLPRWERTKDQTAPYADGLSGGKEATEERTQQPIGRLFY